MHVNYDCRHIYILVFTTLINMQYVLFKYCTMIVKPSHIREINQFKQIVVINI